MPDRGGSWCGGRVARVLVSCVSWLLRRGGQRHRGLARWHCIASRRAYGSVQCLRSEKKSERRSATSCAFAAGESFARLTLTAAPSGWSRPRRSAPSPASVRSRCIDTRDARHYSRSFPVCARPGSRRRRGGPSSARDREGCGASVSSSRMKRSRAARAWRSSASGTNNV